MLFIVVFGLLNTGLGQFNNPIGPSTEALLLLGGWLLVSINPLATVVATEAILLEEQSAFLLRIPLSNGVQFTLVSPWIPYTLFYLLLSALLIWLSIRFVRRVEK
jgi:hypothetical protein